MSVIHYQLKLEQANTTNSLAHCTSMHNASKGGEILSLMKLPCLMTAANL